MNTSTTLLSTPARSSSSSSSSATPVTPPRTTTTNGSTTMMITSSPTNCSNGTVVSSTILGWGQVVKSHQYSNHQPKSIRKEECYNNDVTGSTNNNADNNNTNKTVEQQQEQQQQQQQQLTKDNDKDDNDNAVEGSNSENHDHYRTVTGSSIPSSIVTTPPKKKTTTTTTSTNTTTSTSSTPGLFDHTTPSTPPITSSSTTTIPTEPTTSTSSLSLSSSLFLMGTTAVTVSTSIRCLLSGHFDDILRRMSSSSSSSSNNSQSSHSSLSCSTNNNRSQPKDDQCRRLQQHEQQQQGNNEGPVQQRSTPPPPSSPVRITVLTKTSDHSNCTGTGSNGPYNATTKSTTGTISCGGSDSDPEMMLVHDRATTTTSSSTLNNNNNIDVRTTLNDGSSSNKQQQQQNEDIDGNTSNDNSSKNILRQYGGGCCYCCCSKDSKSIDIFIERCKVQIVTCWKRFLIEVNPKQDWFTTYDIPTQQEIDLLASFVPSASTSFHESIATYVQTNYSTICLLQSIQPYHIRYTIILWKIVLFGLSILTLILGIEYVAKPGFYLAYLTHWSISFCVIYLLVNVINVLCGDTIISNADTNATNSLPCNNTNNINQSTIMKSILPLTVQESSLLSNTTSSYCRTTTTTTSSLNDIGVDCSSTAVPVRLKITWVLYELASITAAGASIVFWPLLIINHTPLTYNLCMNHGGILFLVLTDGIFVNRIPYRIMHWYIFILPIHCLYVIWTLVHDFATTIGNPDTPDDNDPTTNDDALYPVVLEWKNTWYIATATSFSLVFLLGPGVLLTFWYLSIYHVPWHPKFGSTSTNGDNATNSVSTTTATPNLTRLRYRRRRSIETAASTTRTTILTSSTKNTNRTNTTPVGHLT